MGSNENNEKMDADILRCRQDILRSGGSKDGKDMQGRDIVSAEEREALMNDVSADPATDVGSEDIPRFDLADEIMAEHRKVSSKGRRGPGQRSAPQRQERQSYAEPQMSEHSTPTEPDFDPVVAEIVAADIEKLCRRKRW